MYLELPHPTLADNRDDWNRLVGEKGIRPNLKLLQQLPEKIRESDFNAMIVIADDKVIEVESQDTSATHY